MSTKYSLLQIGAVGIIGGLAYQTWDKFEVSKVQQKMGTSSSLIIAEQEKQKAVMTGILGAGLLGVTLLMWRKM